MPPLERLLVLARVPPDFYTVNGTEYTLPTTLINGNPPIPSGPMAVAAACTGLLLLLAIHRLQRSLPSTGVSRLQRCAVVALMVFVFFSSWEMCLQGFARLYGEPAFIADPVTFWKLNPALADQWMGGGHDRIRWWERPTRALPDAASLSEKPSGAYRMMFFGESQLVSIDHQEINLPRSYPRVLQGLLARSFPGRTFEAINAGVPGYSSWQGLLLCRQLLGARPDLVVFAFGYHDSRSSFAADRETLTDDPVVHRVRMVAYRSQLFLLFRKGAIALRESREEHLARTDPTFPTFRVPPSDFEANLRALAQTGRSSGFRVAFLIEPLAHRSNRRGVIGRYHDIMRRVAAEEGAVLLDVFTPMQKLTPADNSVYWDDEIHMSSRGHEAVARILLDLLPGAGLEIFRSPASPAPSPASSLAPSPAPTASP